MNTLLEVHDTPLPQTVRAPGDMTRPRRRDDRVAAVVLVAGLTLFGAAAVSGGVTPLPSGIGSHLMVAHGR